MTDKLERIPFTGIPFSKLEYDRRHNKIYSAMEKAGLDVLIVTQNTHMEYLSGYEGFGSYFAPHPLIFAPGHNPVFVVREYDVANVVANSCIEEVVGYMQRRDFAKATADILRRIGLQAKRIGLELDAWGLAPKDVSLLEDQLPDARFTDGTSIVAMAKAVKGPIEIETMRAAMKLTDLAYEIFNTALQEGISETEMQARMTKRLEQAGGGLRVPVLAFGDRNKLPHPTASGQRIGANEPAMTEMGGVLKNYACGCCRTAILGRHEEAEFLHALATEALDAAIDAMKPGVTAGAVDLAARRSLDKTGHGTMFRHRTGYATAPAWSSRGSPSLEPDEPVVLEAGMTFHMPLHLFGPNGFIIGCSEHVLVTDTGVEILSKTPRQIHFA
ncbi:Xaa-Pro dipeptidase [Bradyrhizobium sp. GM6.1]